MTDSSTPPVTVFELEDLLVAAELELGLNLTILDPHGVLRYGEIPLIRPERWARRQIQACQPDTPECHHHCIIDLDARTQTQRRPFISSCAKGLLELIVPICSHDDYLAAICAGVWQSETGDSDEHDLIMIPVFDPARMERLGTLLSGIALGVSAVWENSLPVLSDSLKAREIRRFVHAHYWRSVRLDELAEALDLSSSRASHLVSELTGHSFRQLLRTERVNAAAMLLKTTDWPITEIGAMVGIPDEHHFNRLFKSAMGLPPGRFRRQ